MFNVQGRLRIEINVNQRQLISYLCSRLILRRRGRSNLTVPKDFVAPMLMTRPPESAPATLTGHNVAAGKYGKLIPATKLGCAIIKP